MNTVHFLVDNGSLRPAATFALRRVADRLSLASGLRVEPVSLLHSSKIPANDLDGVAAETFERALKQRLAAGVRDFVVLPFFIGESRAMTDYLPQVVDRVRQRTGVEFALRCLPPLCPYEQEEDRGIVGELIGRIGLARAQVPAEERWVDVALVDHGSPEPKVGLVRDRMARQLQQHFDGDPSAGIRSVQPCSMERREGAEYDFNEPLLETVVGRADPSRTMIVALLFLSPGRHAGPAGDVAQICERAGTAKGFLFSDVLGESDAVVEILLERLALPDRRQAAKSPTESCN